MQLLRYYRSDDVKKIEAIIKPFKLDEVKEALQEIGLQSYTAARNMLLTSSLSLSLSLLSLTSRSNLH